MSTLLMPHLSTCEQSVRELLSSLNVSPSCAIPQPPLIQSSHVPGSMPMMMTMIVPVSVLTQLPKIFSQQQLQLHLVFMLSLCNYFTSVVISTCRGCVFDSFTLRCVPGCHFIRSFYKNTYLA